MKHPPDETMPNRLRWYRERAGLSQQAVAERIFVSKMTVSDLERGKVPLTLDYMTRISRLYGVAPVDLLNWDDQLQFLRDQEMEIVLKFRAADPVQREMILRVAEPRTPFDHTRPDAGNAPDSAPDEGEGQGDTMSLPQISPMVQAPTCDLGYIRRALGRQRMSERTFIAFVSALIDQRGFPRPLPDYRRGRLVDGVTRHSAFYRASVDAWLDNFIPPEAAEAADKAARAAAAAEMDHAAQHLRLIRGGRA